MRHNTKKGSTRFKSKRHGKTRRIQRGGALIPILDEDNKNQIGQYDDETGIGSATYPEIGVYEGHFENGMPHGLGKLTYMEYRTNELGEVEFVPTGAGYHGNWSHNAMDGHGTYTYPNGDVYEGQWQKDKLHGVGNMKYFDEGVLLCEYNGEWENDFRHGHGIMTYSPSGNVYDGQWVADIKNGHGRLYADGKIMEGEWHDGDFKRSVATRTRSHGLPLLPFEINPGENIEDLVALETRRSPAALITLSDGIARNIHTALVLKARIQAQIEKGISPSNLFNTQLSEDDVSHLNGFLSLLSGGKKRRKR